MAKRSSSSSRTDVWTISRRRLVHRWPAVPTAEKAMPRVARSRSAVGATIAALLPPSSRISRPNRDGDDRGDGAAHAGRPGGRHDRHALVGGERGADVGPALDDLVEVGRRADVGGRPGQERVAGQRGERRLVGRLPDHRVAGDEGEGGVPRPHGDGEVERRDDGARAHRVPRLHQPVAGPLAGDRQAVQLPGEADGEVADVDHLLDLAAALGADLAGLDRDRARRGRPCARGAARRDGARGRPAPAPGVVRQVANAVDRPVARRRRRRPPRRPGRGRRR